MLRLRELVEELSEILGQSRSLTEVRKLWWHGTAPRHVRSILKKGLVPTGTPKVFDPKYQEGGGWTGRSMGTFGGVYLTDNFGTASGAAQTASGLGDKGQVFIGVTYESRTPEALADEDDLISILEWHGVGAKTGNDLFDNHRGFWAPIVTEFRSRWMDNFPFSVSQAPELAKAIETADVSEAIDGMMTQMLKKYPRMARRYEVNKKKIDAMLAELIKAHAMHLIEAVYKQYGPAKIKDIEGSIARAPEWAEKYGSDPESIESSIKGYKEQIRDIEKPPPQFVNTFGPMRDAANKLSRALKEMSDEEATDKFRHNIRVMEPINYRGKNRILLVVERLPRGEGIPEGYVIQDPNRPPTVLVLHYDKGGLKEFLKGWDRHWGGEYFVVNPRGKVLIDNRKAA